METSSIDNRAYAIARIGELMALKAQTQRDIVKTFNEVYPVGSEITYKKNGHVMKGTVDEQDEFYEKVCVLSLTGRRYWVDMYDVLME
jgi:hypothetical protein